MESMTLLVNIIFWAVRILIAGVGVLPGIIKISQGQSDEDPRQRNAGIAAVIISGVCIAATFFIAPLFAEPPPG